MVKFIFEEFIMIDPVNEKGNKYTFSKNANLIIGDDNTVGKSSLLKSIHYTLGADIRDFPNGWEVEKYIFQICLSFENKKIYVKRQNNVIMIVDGSEKQFFSSLREFSENFQHKLGLKLRLNHTRDGLHYAYPESILVPFYIDQDKSWSGMSFRNTFSNLSRYPNNEFQKTIFSYYLGISDSDLIELEAEKKKIQQQKSEISNKIKEIESVYENYKVTSETTVAPPENLESLKKELEVYLKLTNELNEEINKVRRAMNAEKIKLDTGRQDFKELEKLLVDTKETYRAIEHECSQCHSILTREQSLARLELDDNHFQINHKKDIVSLLIKEQEAKISKQRDKLKELNSVFESYRKQISEINEIISIEDFVSQKVLSELQSFKITQISSKDVLIADEKKLEKEIRELKKIIKDKKIGIQTDFELFKNEISNVINSDGLTKLDFLDFKELHGSGVDQNKNQLLFFLIYMNLLGKHSDKLFPFTIDSFTKNETSEKVLTKMFTSIKDNFLTLQSQTFFAVIEDNMKYLKGHSANSINITKPLMTEEGFKKFSSEIIHSDETTK